MKNKNPDKHIQVRVNGNLTGHIDTDGKEHQTYQYHVNINESNAKKSYDYDSEIHIFKTIHTSGQDAVNSEPSENVKPTTKTSPQKEKTTPTLNTGIEKTASQDIIEEKISKPVQKKTSSSKTGLAPRLKKDLFRKTFRNPLKNKIRLPVFKLPRYKIAFPSFSKPDIQLSRITQPIKNAFTFKRKSKPLKTVKEQPAPIVGSIDTLRSRVITTFQTNLTGKRLIKFCLPCIALTAVAISVYFLGNFNIKEKVIYPIDNKVTKPTAEEDSDYHAVIEKTGSGVVITLQGPDHEEILTRLPLGYDPVVEGNKIVHVVTPGNTLWFIAMRYIKNPYRYPELARLNNIKNPDLIYPGEKVVIQYISKP